jgi:hypothetical protein
MGVLRGGTRTLPDAGWISHQKRKAGPSEEVARRAEDGFPNEPVRTLDASHLASALFLRQSFPDLVLLTADERVRANAALLGFPTEALRAQPS